MLRITREGRASVRSMDLEFWSEDGISTGQMKPLAPSIWSYVFVAVQFLCIGVILSTGPWIAKTPVLFLLELGGGVLGMWAVLTMKLRHLSALPEIKANSPLQQGGPYRWIRHPMYSALLLVILALICESWSPWRGVFGGILLVDLGLKLEYEESLLMRIFPEYAAYQQSTYKLIPWIW